MRKFILAVILLAAAGGAIYYLLKKQNAVNSIQQKQIIGRWKIELITDGKDSLTPFVRIMGLIDSNLMKYEYEFKKAGIVVKYLKDIAQRDTSHYEWANDRHLLLKEPGDSIGELLDIITLTGDSLLLRTKDSSAIHFVRRK